MLALSGLLMFVGLALAGVAAIVLAQRSAQAAADLAALAGASAAVAGAGRLRGAAGDIAAANGAALARCELTGTVVTIAVRVDGPRLVARRYDVTARGAGRPADTAAT